LYPQNQARADDKNDLECKKMRRNGRNGNKIKQGPTADAEEKLVRLRNPLPIQNEGQLLSSYTK